jgi:hypothetical protein
MDAIHYVKMKIIHLSNEITRFHHGWMSFMHQPIDNLSIHKGYFFENG